MVLVYSENRTLAKGNKKKKNLEEGRFNNTNPLKNILQTLLAADGKKT